MKRVRDLLLLLAGMTVWPGIVLGGEPTTRPTPIANPADELYQIGEAQRLDGMARQLDLNYRMTLRAGYGPRYPNPFEPWPRVPGDIWGYPLPQPITQPIGQEQIQIGPNRWLSRPIYATPVALPRERANPAQCAAPTAKAASVSRPGPSDAGPDDFQPTSVAPRPKRVTGPRQF